MRRETLYCCVNCATILTKYKERKTLKTKPIVSNCEIRGRTNRIDLGSDHEILLPVSDMNITLSTFNGIFSIWIE